MTLRKGRSSTVNDGNEYVAMLNGDDGRRNLDNDNVDNVYDPDYLFLFVSNTFRLAATL